MYILLCSNGQYYTGSTNNVERRLAQHREGEGSNFTKKHLPVKLVYLEEYDSIEDAFFREKQVQGWRRKKKEALINGVYDRLPALSRPSSLRQAQRPKIVAEHNELDTELVDSSPVVELVETTGKDSDYIE